MIDADKASQIKERIISIVKMKGPSLPVHIAKVLNISPLFTSAFLSELYGERKLFMSYMKIGSSSLYLLPEQEPLLENFIQSLSQRERDAVLLLKEKKLLEDSSLTPVIRVALRSVKDFAIPIKIKITQEPQLFWKYFLVKDNEIMNHLPQNLILEQTVKIPAQELSKEIIVPEKEIPKQLIREPVNIPITRLQETIKEDETIEETEKPKIKKAKKQKEFAFPNKLKDYLLAQDIETIEIIDEKSKDFMAKIRTNESFGKQEYYLIAKDKKKILEIDLVVALQKAQENKMLALIMSPGEIDKKALDFYKSWKNMIKFIKIKL